MVAMAAAMERTITSTAIVMVRATSGAKARAAMITVIKTTTIATDKDDGNGRYYYGCKSGGETRE